MKKLLTPTRASLGYVKPIRFLFLISILFICNNFLYAQDTSLNPDKFYYRITLAGGIGLGVPQQKGDYGFGSSMEFAIQKGKSVCAFGGRELIEFDIFASSNVQENVSSMDLTYGKAYLKKNFYASVSAGIGYVTVVKKGAFLSREGGWFFSHSIYEKITDNAIGIPLSCKVFWLPAKFYGIGMELYANLNLNNSFFGISMAHQLGKLRVSNKK